MMEKEKIGEKPSERVNGVEIIIKKQQPKNEVRSFKCSNVVYQFLECSFCLLAVLIASIVCCWKNCISMNCN